MKGRSPTKEEKQYHDDLCREIGCIVCWHCFDKFNDYCSIHHIDGRTKPNAHKLVIALCAKHHQEEPGDRERGIYAIHPYKRHFEEYYAPQSELKHIADTILKSLGKKVPELEDAVLTIGDCI